MASLFCTSCGAQLPPNVRFCVSCGAQIERDEPVLDQKTNLEESPQVVPPPVPKQSAEKQNPLPVEPPVSAGPIESVPEAQPTASTVVTPKADLKPMVQAASAVVALVGGQTMASGIAGEQTYGSPFQFPKIEGLPPLGPIRYIFSSIKGLFKGFSAALKDKRKLVSVTILAIVWIAYAALRYFKVEANWLDGLSIATFAHGGLSTDPARIAGGILGKTMVAFVFTRFTTQLLSFKNPFAGSLTAIKAYFKSLSAGNAKAYAPLVFGVGLALVVYNAIGGTVSLSSAAVGVSGFILSIRALGQKTGFVKGLYTAFYSRSKKKKALDLSGVNRLMAGLTTGFALSTGLAYTETATLGYLVGLPVLLIGILLLFVPVGEKKAVVS